MSVRLEELVLASASRHPDRTAAEDPTHDTEITYRELDALSDEVRDLLVEFGVHPGDRVGVLGKSIPVLVSIFGVLKARGAYVPVDAAAPMLRGAGILEDCAVKAVIAPAELATELAGALEHDVHPARPLAMLGGLGPDLVVLPGPSPGDDTERARNPVGEELAYVLYTSGSTGVPKGVMHTHASASSFVDWCTTELAPTETDRFSSHAPFHFDLSILDIYVPLKHGATVVLIDGELGKQPAGLASVIAEREISVWYSTPSILSLLVEYGKPQRFEYPRLRLVLFAGEVFPLPALRRVMALWPTPSYYNLYGPTETNVCTFHALPREIDEDRVRPIPIGVVCSGDEARVMDRSGQVVARGARGELCVRGGSVMLGYWGQPERTRESYWDDPEGAWYRTGDVVAEADDGYEFFGRRDRMIKRRGYRIEPGEIEAALHGHPQVVEAAVVARADPDGVVRIVAFVSCRDGGTLPLIALKKWCADNLPLYMVPDAFSFAESLPRTSTDKIDYQKLMSSL